MEQEKTVADLAPGDMFRISSRHRILHKVEKNIDLNEVLGAPRHHKDHRCIVLSTCRQYVAHSSKKVLIKTP